MTNGQIHGCVVVVVEAADREEGPAAEATRHVVVTVVVAATRPHPIITTLTNNEVEEEGVRWPDLRHQEAGRRVQEVAPIFAGEVTPPALLVAHPRRQEDHPAVPGKFSAAF